MEQVVAFLSCFTGTITKYFNYTMQIIFDASCQVAILLIKTAWLSMDTTNYITFQLPTQASLRCTADNMIVEVRIAKVNIVISCATSKTSCMKDDDEYHLDKDAIRRLRTVARSETHPFGITIREAADAFA